MLIASRSFSLLVFQLRLHDSLLQRGLRRSFLELVGLDHRILVGLLLEGLHLVLQLVRGESLSASSKSEFSIFLLDHLIPHHDVNQVVQLIVQVKNLVLHDLDGSFIGIWVGKHIFIMLPLILEPVSALSHLVFELIDLLLRVDIVLSVSSGNISVLFVLNNSIEVLNTLSDSVCSLL